MDRLSASTGYSAHFSQKPIKKKNNKALIMTGIIAFACVCLLFLALVASTNTKPFMPPKVAQKYMSYWLIDSSRRVAGNVRLRHSQAMEMFYLKREYQPVWMNSFELTEAGKKLLQILQETAADDWRDYGYAISTIEEEAKQLSNIPKQATAVDVLLTDAFITYAKQVLNQELLPDTGESDHPSYKKVAADIGKSLGDQIRSEDIVQLLKNHVDKNELVNLVENLAPTHSGYLQLREKLRTYQALADSGEWYPLPNDFQIALNERNRLVPHVRWMLTQYGDVKEGSFDWFFKKEKLLMESPRKTDQYDLSKVDYLFDEILVEAIKNFQKRNKLEVTGQVDKKTLAALNIPPYHMAQKIALNMKRWRHLPKELGQRHIMVNMADYRLQLVDGKKTTLDMKVIIGRAMRRTPVLSQTVSTVVLAPTWSVPRRIAVGDLLPKLKRDPNYLHRGGYSLVQNIKGIDRYVSSENINWKKYNASYFPFRLVQKAGKDNALGTVKFMLPNDQSIYLHDTSHPELFGRDMRALSSGCVRVEKPFELANTLINSQQGWNSSRISNVIKQNRTTYLKLHNPVPVYLMYWTVWVDKNGDMQVRDDVYQRDLIGTRSKNHIATL